MNENAITEIDPNAWYRISDIVRHGWIANTKSRATRPYVWALIKRGTLTARNRASSKTLPLWMVRGSDIITYIKHTYL